MTAQQKQLSKMLEGIVEIASAKGEFALCAILCWTLAAMHSDQTESLADGMKPLAEQQQLVIDAQIQLAKDGGK